MMCTSASKQRSLVAGNKSFDDIESARAVADSLQKIRIWRLASIAKPMLEVRCFRYLKCQFDFHIFA
jgi:hypothetical protein